MLVHTLRHHGDIIVDINRSPTFYFSTFACSYWLHDITPYRKVPKVTTLFTFGFRSHLLSLLLEGRYFWHLLTPVKFYRYFRIVSTFGGSLLWELYGIMKKCHYAYLGISHVIIGNQNYCALVDMSCMVNRMCCVRLSQSPFPFLPEESRKCLLVDEGIQGFEIQNLALEIRNPSNGIRNWETGIRNPRRGILNPTLSSGFLRMGLP